ncbi:MAG TPA: hypothetical protein VF826_13210 [Chloroflexia bacterium]|jgi:hypothetical protein
MKLKPAIALVAVATLFALQGIAPDIVAACSPAVYTPRSAFDEADVVFMGTVTGLTEEAQLAANGVDYTLHYTYAFRVLTSWKGVSQPQVMVRWKKHIDLPEPDAPPFPFPPCGPVGFDAGATYLVYANYDSNNIPLTMIYSGRNDIPIRSVNDVAEEFRLFGPGKQWSQPAGVGMPKAGEGASSLDNTLAIGLLVLGLGLALTKAVSGRDRGLMS